LVHEGADQLDDFPAFQEDSQVFRSASETGFAANEVPLQPGWIGKPPRKIRFTEVEKLLKNGVRVK